MARPTCPTCPRAFDVGVPSCPRARVPKFSACPRAFHVGVPSCPRALVPSMLACPRFLVPKFSACPRVPSMLMFRTLLRDVTLEVFPESLNLSDPFFLNFIRKNLSREF